MEDRSIHKNLDTSFVNLSALIKYLRRRQFSGCVKVQLNGYRAEITLRGDNTISVHEHDQISGRVSDGEEAFQRVLIRAREAGGTINVFQAVAPGQKAVKSAAAPLTKNVKKPAPGVKAAGEQVIRKPTHPPVPVAAKRPQTNGFAKKNGNSNIAENGAPQKTNAAAAGFSGKNPQVNSVSSKTLPDFPFVLSNKVEAKAQRELTSPEDWQNLLKLTVELLTVIDRSLAAANLNFAAEFQKICTEIADDYPFLDPNNEVFSYSNGRILMSKQMSAKIFISGISEVLRKILVKLSKSGKYSEIYKLTS
ncbi:MAG: hypothetical protein KDB79_06130, partial [Acidobacteria bacterium]|nr:hypothetical protein [Acidobacteriota bacterium]